MLELAGEERPALLRELAVGVGEPVSDALVQMKPAAGLAGQRTRHERRDETRVGRRLAHDLFGEDEGVGKFHGGQRRQIDLVLAGASLVMHGVDDDARIGELVGGLAHDLDADALGLDEVAGGVDGHAIGVEQVELEFRRERERRAELTGVVEHHRQRGARVSEPRRAVVAQHDADGTPDPVRADDHR